VPLERPPRVGVERPLAGSRYDLQVEDVDRPDVDADPDGLTGYVHSIETCGTLDGPGMRYVLFLSGCQLRCQYCHNPDTWHLKHGRKTSVEEVMADIGKYAQFLRKYRGGVTISGGEPLVQAAFLARILRRCKELDLHTVLDTNGYLGDRIQGQMMQDIDLFLLDLKAWDRDTHLAVTGVEPGPIQTFARRLSDEGRPMWIRFVLVPGLTDAVADVDGLASFAASLNGVERIEILPFHKMGEFKWSELGLDYKLRDTDPPAPDLLARVQQQFADKGLVVV